MKRHTTAPLLALASLVAAGSVSASTLGLPNGSFATTWDTFAGINVADDAPDASTGQVTATLTTLLVGGSTPGGGERLYSGSGATPNPFNMTVGGTANVSLTDIGIVLKFTSPLQTATPEQHLAASAGHFTLTLDGAGAATQTYLGNSLEGSNNFYIYQWTWTGLDLSAGDDFQFAISSDPGHVSLDAIQIVPEPTSAMLGSLAAALFVLRRRKA